MASTTVEIDEKACAKVMQLYNFKTKDEAINFALRRMAREPMTAEEASAMRGTGWYGDLDEMRANRIW